MMWLLLACAGPTQDDTASDRVIPVEGAWMVNWDQTYGGDCVLAEMETRQPASIEWAVELESIGFTLYDETGYPMGCDLEAGAFTCSLGVTHADYSPSGYDAVEAVAIWIEGRFSTPTSFDATYNVEATCFGDDCDSVGSAYGGQFEYPCTAVAGLDGNASP